MAPPPEYDKEPKAPDKSATNNNCEDSKTINNSSSEQYTVSDSKAANNVNNSDVENNKHVETLDDGQLRALLDEAITYKCPKDREGKSSLFKELLEEVEQDEQACEAAARELTGSRGRRAGRGRRALPHSNSLQDLVAALAAESAPRRTRAVPVSTRAIHGGSLPSGVDTSFLLSEEPPRGGYLATVRCVNPPPLCERASTDDDHRRSKPTPGVTYTARATLEIGGGRAVTSTIASHQVRTSLPGDRQPRGPRTNRKLDPEKPNCHTKNPFLEVIQKGALTNANDTGNLTDDTSEPRKYRIETRSWRNNARKIQKQKKPRISTIEIGRGLDKKCLKNFKMNDITKTIIAETSENGREKHCVTKTSNDKPTKIERSIEDQKLNMPNLKPKNIEFSSKAKPKALNSNAWLSNVNSWYKELHNNSLIHNVFFDNRSTISSKGTLNLPTKSKDIMDPSIDTNDTAVGLGVSTEQDCGFPLKRPDFTPRGKRSNLYEEDETLKIYLKVNNVISERNSVGDDSLSDLVEQIKYRKRVGMNLKAPSVSNINPKNVKSMTIGKQPAVPFQPEPSTSNCFNDNLKLLYKKSKTKDIDNEISLCKNTKKPVDVVSPSVEKSEDLCRKLSAKSDQCDKTVNTGHATCDNSEFTAVEYGGNISQLLNVNVPHIVKNVSNVGRIDFKGATQIIGTEVQTEVNVEVQERKGNPEPDAVELIEIKPNKDVQLEMQDMSCPNSAVSENHSFSTYYADQERLLRIIESNNDVSDLKIFEDNSEKVHKHDVGIKNSKHNPSKKRVITMSGTIIETDGITDNVPVDSNTIEPKIEKITGDNESEICKSNADKQSENISDSPKETEIARPSTSEPEKPPGEQYVLAELPNNAYIFLTLPQCLLTDKTDVPIEVNNHNSVASPKSAKKKSKESKTTDRQNRMIVNKNVLRELLFENLFKSISEKSTSSLSAIKEVEVDSTIQFNCITTPEVVASCNTTPSTPSAVTIDPKPLQLGSCYRAVASLTAPLETAPLNTSDESNVSPSTNGLPLSRTSSDDYKKSLDENGNSVSPVGGAAGAGGAAGPGGLGGLGGGKKRGARRRASRNETVTKSDHIDGYQGNKDLNELLRFIEASGAPRPRRKPPQEPDKKKRRKAASAVRARAASLDARATPPPAPPAPPAPEPEPAAAAGFTTVSRRRRARRKPPSPPASPPPSPPASPPPPRRPAAAVPDLIESLGVPAPPRTRPDVLCRRRPAPVQLPRAPPPPPGLTFGFDLNHTLLPDDPPPARPLSPPSPPPPPHEARRDPHREPRHSPHHSPRRSPRRSPHHSPHHSPHIAALVTYVSDAWDEVIKCLGGKVRYYNE